MSEMTLSDVDRLCAFEAAERTFQMNEEAFRAFYEQTARPVWIYLTRITGDARLADDLLQETYYRFLRASASFASEEHRRHYLFRIATNLVRDHRRHPRRENVSVAEHVRELPADEWTAERAARQIDLQRALGQLKPRERSLLWLAYAQGFSHEEIAMSLGLKAASLKTLLYRARRRLLALLTDAGARGDR